LNIEIDCGLTKQGGLLLGLEFNGIDFAVFHTDGFVDFAVVAFGDETD
jgi:hypothetical protein